MLVVDHTILKSVATCELAAWLRHVGGWTSRDEHASLLAGRAAHTALAAHFRGADGMAAFEAAYRPWAELHAQDRPALAWPNARDVMHHWFARVAPLLDWEVVGVEERVERALTSTVLCCGRVDLRIRSRQYGVAIIDHKTTQRLGEGWADQWHLDAQMTDYAWTAAEQQAAQFYVNGIEWTRLPTSTMQCKTHGTSFTVCRQAHAVTRLVGPYQRRPDQIARWYHTAVALSYTFRRLTVTPLHEVLATGELTGACRYCQFRTWCTLGRQERQLDALCVHQPWTPGGAAEEII